MIEKMSDTELLEAIRKGFIKAFGSGIKSITLESKPEDINGWDSLGHTLLISELESIFSISFDLDEMMEMEDVSAIVRVLYRHMN